MDLDDMGARELRERYVADLTASGQLRSQQLIDAFRQVPRHVFVPRLYRRNDADQYEAIDSSNPAWLPMVYSDSVLTTQLDGDDDLWITALTTPVVGQPTSSSSQPSLMVQMLEALALTDGDRVLEIGTGSGYNAALMSHRLGARQITTVEVDHRLCARAEAVLHRCGYAPTVVCGDGTNGYEAGAPYDRVIATCSVPSIPISWVDQTTAGGLILASLYRPLGGGPLVRLTAAGDGTAQGVFLPGGGGFMPVRDHPTPDAMPLFKTAMATEPDRPSRSSAVPPDVFDHTDFGMLAALVLEDVTTIQFQPADGDEQRWLLASNGAWACLDIATKTVTQRGPRYLWDELEATFATWRCAGEPTREQTGLTVTLDRQWIWLHHPDQPVRPCG